MQFENHKQWPSVKQVCEKLTAAGYKAWLAGGCVRDALLGCEPKDFDIATNAKPEAIQKIFPGSLPIGKQFGIIILPFDGYQIEVATFRKDGPYKDGRHPESVSFATAEEDALRRDFTMNALFYDPTTAKVIDFVGGEKDIRAKLIRCVGDSHARFAEDKLRILRAFRFVAQLGFELERKTFVATKSFSLREVSRERVREEFLRLLISPFSLRGLSFLSQSQLLVEIISEITTAEDLWTNKSQLSPWLQSKLLLSHCDIHDKEILLALAILPSCCLLEDKGKGAATQIGRRICENLKLSNDFKNAVTFILENWREGLVFSNLKTSDLLLLFSQKHSPMLLQALRSHFNWTAKVDEWNTLQSRVRTVLPPLGALPEPLLSSEDVITLGAQGAQIGEWLKSSFRAQLDGVVKTKSEALAWVKKKS